METTIKVEQNMPGYKLADEFAKQLHEQYSINDNAKASHVVGFIAAIAFVFIGFGYVYIQPYLRSTEIADYSTLLKSVDILANVLLCLLGILCINFGYSTRRDHVVITRIRKEYAKEETERWFNGQYNGCNKNGFNYIPNYYSIMFVFIQIFIVLLAVGCSYNIYSGDVPKCLWWLIAFAPILIILLCWCCHYCKYTKFLTDNDKKDK